VPVDVPIDIPKKEGAPSLPLPPPRVASAAPATARVASGVIAERQAEARREADTAAVAKPAETPKPAAAPARPAAASAPTDDGQRAKALLEGKTAESKPTQLAEARAAKPPAAAQGASSDKAEPAAGGRFVVQIAAYADMSPARDMRQRLEKLGLKSYLQTVEINGATRIRVRVGPYPSREEADKAAETIKAAGLPAAVLTL
jgi:DedD protein